MVGAGIGRTGTMSLKVALERLIRGRCYHMVEVLARPADIAVWRRAAAGVMPDWEAFLGDYRAAVDWPAAAFWSELVAASPDAVVLLSTRESPETWWRSAERTIFSVPAALRRKQARGSGLSPMDWVDELLSARFTPHWQDRSEAIAAYERLVEEVRRAVPPARLVEWRPGDGWEPLCRALAVPVPAEPFPHLNTEEEFRRRLGLDLAPEEASRD